MTEKPIVGKGMVWLLVGMLGLVSGCAGDKAVEEPVQPSAPSADQTEQLGDLDAFPSGGGQMSLADQTVYFAFDDYSLGSQAQASLDEISNYMQGESGMRIKLEGHCDERGSTEYNLALGMKRAQAVKNYLMQLGIDENRLPTISYGEEKPAAEGHDESAWSLNRRVEFVLQSE